METHPRKFFFLLFFRVTTERWLYAESSAGINAHTPWHFSNAIPGVYFFFGLAQRKSIKKNFGAKLRFASLFIIWSQNTTPIKIQSVLILFSFQLKWNFISRTEAKRSFAGSFLCLLSFEKESRSAVGIVHGAPNQYPLECTPVKRNERI